ncbi:MAG: outer membrane lipoprotein carrier protein LolA [Deltaproteobacteria bacterium]|nr:outer membrane lipoprotein carrier protein LolA [Deltaproteobacteria bacterium]
MRKRRFFRRGLLLVLTALMLAPPLPAAARQVDQEQLLARIRKVFQQKRLWVGDFVQRAMVPDVAEPQVSRGKVYFQLPDKMRWEFVRPRQTLVSDGQTIWFYDADLQQVMIGKVASLMEARLMLRLLSQVASLERDYQVTVRHPGQGEPISVRLVPREQGTAGKPFTSLELDFDPDTCWLRESRLVDLFANRIRITYRWQAQAKPLPAGFFRFVVPPGTEVVPMGEP